MDNSHLFYPGIDFLAAFRRQHGRPLRVLHIGNIANNAYQNAKLLNALGADCDVICRGYYHIMACPEWEDADFSRLALDESRPDWATTNLNGYKRPKWFVQGHEIFCLDYLLARRTKNRLENKYWLFLSLCNRTAKIEALDAFDRIESRLRITFDFVSRRLNKMLLEPRTILLKRIKFWLSANGVDIVHGRGRLIHFGLVTLVLATAGMLRILLAPYLLLRMLNRLAQRSQLDNRVAKLASVFRQGFPERTDGITLKDIQFQSLNHQLSKWAKLFRYYDLVHAYATDGIYPLLAGKPFIAFEHGTLRDIPFEVTPQGRCCALSYRCADYVLITNADNRDAAQKLGVRKYGFIPHMVNESFLPGSKEKQDLYRKLHEDLASPFIVFHPPRHHWSVERKLEGDKGNDIFLTGFAKFIKDCEPKAKVLLVKWGTTLGQSISLIERLGITSNVRWILAQPHREMIRFICSSDMVADQFVLGAFGNIMPMTLFCGRPAMLFLDEGMHSWCFDTMPPVINAKNSEEVFAGLCKVHENKAFVNELITRGHDWYSKYHSNKRVGEILQSAYAGVLSESRGVQP
jgi:hypothetical protein